MSTTSPVLLLPTDRIVTARFPSVNLALVYADVTRAARGLEASHLSGPAASRALAEGLVAAALLSAETDDPDEAVSFQLNVHGPVGTVFAEATGAGHLRGYTKAKTLNSDISPIIKEEIRQKVAAGEIHILYLSPETLLARIRNPQLPFSWTHIRTNPVWRKSTKAG